MPLLAATVGIDGGPIFQLIATENLDISPTALGLAFGAGVISLPFQLLAARIPLRRARPNLQLFLMVSAAQTWVLALLVAIGATGALAVTALVVTITAEITLSILFATAWQPLLSFAVDAHTRQRLNTTFQALARGLLAGSVIAFALLAPVGRTAFIVTVGVAAALVAIGMQHVIATPPSTTSPSVHIDEGAAAQHRVRPTAVFVVIALANVAAMPLWLVYLDRVLWPSGNLGAVAAAQIAASVAVLLVWRPTDRDLHRRTTLAALVVLCATAAILFLRAPVYGPSGSMIVLIATVLAAAGTTLIRVATLEQAHRLVDAADAVRTFTVLDVVASTSLQAGLLVAGLLITASESSATSVIDPYKLLLAIAAGGTLVSTLRRPAARRTLTPARRSSP